MSLFHGVIRRKLVFGALGAFLLVLALCGAGITLSALFDSQTNRFLRAWNADKSNFSPRAWRVALGSAGNAVAIFPGQSAGLYAKLGLVLEWGEHELPIGSPEARDLRLRALAAYRVAADLVPTWPYYWLDLVSVKVRLGDYDDEMLHALTRAFEGGPWRSGVLGRLTLLGMASWWQMPNSGRELTLEAARRVLLGNDDREVLRLWLLMKKVKGDLIVCSVLHGSVPRLEKLCSDAPEI
jgi:hypothetical protein